MKLHVWWIQRLIRSNKWLTIPCAGLWRDKLDLKHSTHPERKRKKRNWRWYCDWQAFFDRHCVTSYNNWQFVHIYMYVAKCGVFLWNQINLLFAFMYVCGRTTYILARHIAPLQLTRWTHRDTPSCPKIYYLFYFKHILRREDMSPYLHGCIYCHPLPWP